ncbi:MAG: hypothetical protein HW406_58 [Candidatus Brocadiaceae bacterium]|nr:hypothetical protein [Candidatus Brocadiaceae bacterium]
MKPFSIFQIANYFHSRYAAKSCVCKAEPVSICLFLTDRCTLSCKWCLRQTDTSFNTRTRVDMSLETVNRILPYFPKATHVSLAGFGEPLLVDNLFKIVAECKKRPMRVNLITNGTLLTERIEEIIQAGLHRISISMNSLNSSEYQSTCGGSETTFHTVLKGIELLVRKRTSKKPYLHISFVLSRDLFKRIAEIIKFAEDAGVDFLDMHNLISHDKDDIYKGMLTSDDEEVNVCLNEWRKKEYKVKVGWPVLVQKGLEKPVRICKTLWGWIGVDMEGNTAGCSKAMPTNIKYGNLFKEGTKVWNNEFRKGLRMSFLNRDKFLLDCCKTCTEVQP